MYRILLVDDEPWVLEGLIASIPWAAHGFEVCGTAENGLVARARIAALQPDAVLADIRMPGLDGIALLREVRQAHPSLCFAFLSGHADFGYAQEGLRHGIEGYLLKPVEEAEAGALLDKMARRLAERNEQRLLDDLASDGRLFLRKAYPKGAYLWQQLGGQRLETLPVTYGCRLGGSRHMMISSDAPEDIDALEAWLPPEVKGLGIAHWLPERPLEEALFQAGEAAHVNFFTPGKRAAFYKRSSLRAADLVEGLARAVQSRRQIHRECVRLAALLPQMSLTQLTRLWSVAHAGGEEVDWTPTDLPSRFVSAVEVLEAIERALFQPAQPGAGVDMADVEAYLCAHYRQPLALDEIAARFAISTSALCQRFKRHAGCGIARMLQNLRMGEACRLLTETERSVNDVANAVGYEDALYFRKVFRKATGTTPTDYRAGCQASNEAGTHPSSRHT